jgi:hypothetical protein
MGEITDMIPKNYRTVACCATCKNLANDPRYDDEFICAKSGLIDPDLWCTCDDYIKDRSYYDE